MAQQTVVVGGGVGGLTAAVELARRGHAVTLLEQADRIGGKMRREIVAGRPIDVGPTVLTMRPVFEQIFDAAGAKLTDYVTLKPVEILARHAWPDGKTLDLFVDVDRSAEAIARVFGPREAHGYRRFCAYAQRIHDHVKDTFLFAERPSFVSILKAIGTIGVSSLLQMDGYRTMWTALGDFFSEPKLLQLFGRYATYSGSSPFDAPATLNVIAHVERTGVWLVEGGMFAIAEALLHLAQRLGVTIRTEARVTEVVVEGGAATAVRLASGERIDARAIVMNADAGALAAGLFGSASKRAASAPSPRSLSAFTWAMVVETEGFPLVRHNVFFSTDYARETRQIFDHGAVPDEPTVYVCAQDRADLPMDSLGAERLLCLINAPADGDRRDCSSEKTRCERSMMGLLSRCGLALRPIESPIVTTPTDFAKRFPATGGALYGAASHGWKSPFVRPGARSKIPGLYLSGGSAHPGAGVPMVAQSGRLAAMAVHEDFVSSARSRRAATHGGMSMR